MMGYSVNFLTLSPSEFKTVTVFKFVNVLYMYVVLVKKEYHISMTNFVSSLIL